MKRLPGLVNSPGLVIGIHCALPPISSGLSDIHIHSKLKNDGHLAPKLKYVRFRVIGDASNVFNLGVNNRVIACVICDINIVMISFFLCRMELDIAALVRRHSIGGTVVHLQVKMQNTSS